MSENIIELDFKNKSSAKDEFVSITLSAGAPKKMSEDIYDRLEFFYETVINPVQEKGIAINLPDGFSEDQIGVIRECLNKGFSEYCTIFDSVLFADRLILELDFYKLQYPDFRK